MLKKSVMLVACAGMLVSVLAYGAGDPTAGKAKSAVCTPCHGADGNSPNPEWPNLAGQLPEYIVKQLHDFKSGVRSNPIMSGIVASLSDQDMQDLAAYFAGQELKITGATDAELAHAGERLYRGGDRQTQVPACMGCHLPNGLGIPVRFPRLSGQHARYVELQLQAFKSGQRHNDGDTMVPITARMSEEQIKAVAQYISGLY
jgi:cytochrome c553